MNPAVRPPRQQPLLPPHLRRDSAHPCRICAGTGPHAGTTAIVATIIGRSLILVETELGGAVVAQGNREIAVRK